MAKKEKKAEKANDTPEPTKAEPTKAEAKKAAPPEAEASPIASPATEQSVAAMAAHKVAMMKPRPAARRAPRSDAERAGLFGSFSRDTRQGAPKMFGKRSTPESRGKVVKRKPLRHAFGRSAAPAKTPEGVAGS